jgi:vacuolar-type H+-ATPase subunit I/STV1
MLNRTNKSERIIGMNKQLCLQLEKEIDIIKDKLTKLDEQFKIKKNTFSTVNVFEIIEKTCFYNKYKIGCRRLS